jgi:hypothetical protein
MTIYVFKIWDGPKQQEMISALRSVAVGCEVAQCSSEGAARVTVSVKDDAEALSVFLIAGSPCEIV